MAGLATSVTLGSGDSDSFTYDSNTNRTTQFQFHVGAQNYTGGLTWNSNGSLAQQNITDSFNSSDTQNCSYAHDDLARIASVNCGSPWSQTFGYDAFGNLTKSGSENFAASYSATTNHITTVSTCAPSYDADGNYLTGDLNNCLNNFTWNAYGKLTGMGSATVTYDAFGRQVDFSYPTEMFYTPTGDMILFNGQVAGRLYLGLFRCPGLHLPHRSAKSDWLVARH